MPQIDINGHRCHYQLDGPQDAPVLVLSHALGAASGMWDAQLPALTPSLRVLRHDTRGHGRSQATPGEYSAALLGQDVLALTAALGIESFSFCGLSLGGLVGQWLGLNAGPRLQKLVLCNTAAKIGNPETWATRIATVRRDGTAAVVEATLARWFTPEFSAAEPASVDAIRQQILSSDREGYASACAAVRDADFRGALQGIAVPTLVIAGTRDVGTTVADAELLSREIPGARQVVLESAHLSNLNAREMFNAALESFLLMG